MTDSQQIEAKAGLRYALRRISRLLNPPVTVTAAPADVLFDRDVEIPMRDGTRLRANVFRPVKEGRFPIIMSAHPYSKDHLPKPGKPLFQYRVMQQSMPITHSELTGWEAPDPAYWVPKGYVVVNLDLRGFGRSDGDSALLTALEGQDYFDAIEWLAKQPWCSGKVGLNGVSYLAISQWRVAAERPPSLAAICPWEGFTNAYFDVGRPGGILDQGFFKLWGGQLLKRGRNAVSLHEAARRHENYDDWWKSLAPDLAAIEVPALICASFSDQLLHSGGSFRGFEKISSNDKWLYTHRGPKWGTYYSEEVQALLVRFFDHFLKGENNGFETTPRVRVEVRDTGDAIDRIITSDQWPPDTVEPLNLYLHAEGLLQEGETASGAIDFDLTRGKASFLWTVPFDLEVIGKMRLKLFAELVGAKDALLFASIHKFREHKEVVFEGSFGFPLDNVTKGWLQLSKRQLGPERESLWDVPLTFEKQQPLSAEEIVSAEIPLMESATAFKAGDLIRLDIQGFWPSPHHPLFGNFPAQYERSPKGRCILHVGGTHDSQIILPVMSK